MDRRPRLAVVGFEPAPGGDPRDAWIAVGLEELLADRLLHLPGVDVVPTLRLYQARNELTNSPTTPPAWVDVARAVGAGFLLTGRCRGPDNATALELRLVDLGRAELPAKQTEIPPGRLFVTLDRATEWTLDACELGDVRAAERGVIFAPPSSTTTTIEYYALALSAARAAKTRDATRYAAQALQADARFRPALAVLAQLEMQLGPSGRGSAGRRLRVLGDLARLEHDPVDQARAEIGQALLALADASFDAASTRAETALAVAYERDDLYGQLAALTVLCDSYLLREAPQTPGLSPAARDTYSRQSLLHAAEWQSVLVDMLDIVGDLVASLPATSKLALIYERLGQSDSAFALHRRTLELADRLQSRRHQATAWLCLGQWYRDHERAAEARDALTRCLALADEDAQPPVRMILGDVYRTLTLHEEALAQFELACEQARQADDLASQFACLRAIAATRMQLGRREKAIAALQEAIDIAHVLALREESALRAELERWKNSDGT
jgi:tetratricopeptide (TPR) repeat protein